MATFSVIGATPENLNSLRTVKTIPGMKTKNGSAQPDLKYKDEYKEEEKRYIHPFQLGLDVPYPFIIGLDVIHTYYQQYIPISGVQSISIEEGRIQICSDSQERTYVQFYEDNALPVSGLTEDDQYYIVLALRYDPYGEGDIFDNGYFPCNAYFIPSDASTADVPAVPGFQTIIVGSIIRETISGVPFFSLNTQQLDSDLFYDFRPSLRPFSITADSTKFENGKLKDSYSINQFDFNIRSGTAIIGQQEIIIPEYNFKCTNNTYVYCTITEENTSGYIYTTENQQQFYDAENKEWNYLVGYIEFDASQNGLAINQYICQQIATGADTYKVKSREQDAKPDYLEDKFIFQKAISAWPVSAYWDQLIGYEPISSRVTDPGLSGIQYKIAPIWLWRNIENFDENKQQYLTNARNHLKWTAGGIDVSGSLADWEEIRAISGTNNLVWKPEYQNPTLRNNFYFMASVKTPPGHNQKEVLSGVSFGTHNKSKQAVMIWDQVSGLPKIISPPPSSEITSTWVLVGQETSGLHWMPYTTSSGLMSLSGSINNLFETVDTTSGRILRVKTEYNQSINQFHFVNLTSNGALTAWTISGDPQVEGLQGLITWNYDFETPQQFLCMSEFDLSDEFSHFVLAGTVETGLYWIDLLEELSGDLYLVKATPDDISAGFLTEKVDSELSSLILTLEDDNGEKYINFQINPDYFYSEDGSIAIEPDQNGEGLNFYLSSYLVQVEEEDIPDYLFNKLGSENGSITGYITHNDYYSGISLEVNPQYFTSSDGSIVIEENENGLLDFYLSSYLVQVEEGDQPDYLFNKLGSENGSITGYITEDGGQSKVSLQINPQYFTSSDGSISIEDTEDGLDFILSTYLVQAEEDDIPGYLSQKLDSSSGSISITKPEDGGNTVINFQINPDYFYSSDGSIGIQQDNNGLDLVVSSYLTQVDSTDQPGYLGDKLDSTSGSISVTPMTNSADGYINLQINGSYFYSSNGTVSIEQDNGLDFTVDESTLSTMVENTIQQTISSAVSTMVNSYVTDILSGVLSGMLSSLFPSGTGLLYINDGQLSVIPIGTGVAVGDGNTLAFEQPEPCD